MFTSTVMIIIMNKCHFSIKLHEYFIFYGYKLMFRSWLDSHFLEVNIYACKHISFLI